MGLQTRAVCRRHCVGGSTPVNFGRRWHGVGGPKIFSKDSRTNFVLSSKFSDNLFLVIGNCNKIRTQQQLHWRHAHKLSAVAAQPVHGSTSDWLCADGSYVCLPDLLSRPLKKLETKTLITGLETKIKTLITRSRDQDLGHQVSRPRPWSPGLETKTKTLAFIPYCVYVYIKHI